MQRRISVPISVHAMRKPPASATRSFVGWRGWDWSSARDGASTERRTPTSRGTIHSRSRCARGHVWIAIPHKARVPTLGRLPVRFTRFSSAALTYGVEDTHFEGVPAGITTPARTVVDCFRFRSKIGLEPALEALHDALDDGKATMGQIWRAAEVCGARSLVGPALRMRSY